MKILITGAAGTLGLPLLHALSSNHSVIGCDLAHSADNKIIRTDVRNYRQLQEVFSLYQPELVFHFAAEFGRKNGQEYWEDLWTTNCIGTRNVIECCKAHDAFLVFASSSEAYGTLAENGPLYEALLDCAMPQFYNEYALSKLANEKQIQLSGVKHLILRLFNVYGPGEHFNGYRSVISRFLHAAIHNETLYAFQGSRTFLYIDDFIRAMCMIPEKLDELSSEVVNCADDATIGIPELADLCIGICGGGKIERIPFVESNTVSTKTPDIAKFKEFLSYEKKIPLVEGLRHTMAWMKTYD